MRVYKFAKGDSVRHIDSGKEYIVVEVDALVSPFWYLLDSGSCVHESKLVYARTFWILKRAPKNGKCGGANYKSTTYSTEAKAIEAAKQALHYDDNIDYVVLKSVYFTNGGPS